MAFVAFGVVDALGRRAARRIGREVVIVDLFSFATPGLAGIFELAEEFLLLGIDADSRVATAAEFLAMFGDMPELPIAFGVRLSGVQHFAVTSLAVLRFSQQSTDRRWTAAVIQLHGQPSQPRADPLLVGTRIAGCFGINALQQVGDQGRVFFSTRGRPPPGRRTRSVGRARNSSPSSSRPRRIVSGCRPVISAIRVIPPCPR